MLDMSHGTHRAESNWLPHLVVPPNGLRPHASHEQGGILKLRSALDRLDRVELVVERPSLMEVYCSTS
jgi:hypothetical protein